MNTNDPATPPKQTAAFICVHNSCRSQIAEALAKHFASDRHEFYSAGTETKPRINQDAVRLVKELYGIDMEKNGQKTKLLSDGFHFYLFLIDYRKFHFIEAG